MEIKDLLKYELMAGKGEGGGGTTDYNALINKPSIGGVTLLGNKTPDDFGFSTADCEKLSNKVTEIVRKTASDTNYPSEKAVSDALTSLSTNLNNSINGFYNTLSSAIALSEEVANKVTAIDGASPTDTHYPSEKAVADALTSLGTNLSNSFGSQINGLSQAVFQSLGYKENSSNKSTSISGSGSATNYPTTKAVVDYVTDVVPDTTDFEEVANKVDTIGSSVTVQSDLYPTVNAVTNFFTSMKTTSTTQTASNKAKIPTFGTVINYVESQFADIDTALDAIIGGDY